MHSIVFPQLSTIFVDNSPYNLITFRTPFNQSFFLFPVKINLNQLFKTILCSSPMNFICLNG